ncbi:MAG: hypothetical protein IJ428_00815 [Clostridia bacterium]|nr:hypothetical protein [Clostridia bacterium]
MFGYIKPVAAELKVKEYELYRAVYCGLCAALGRNTTCVSRLSLSYDFVFLAVVRMALAGERGKIEKRRCIAHPAKKRAVLADAAQLDYCARLSSVLTYHKVCDDISDDRGIKRLGARLVLPIAAIMRKRAEMDSDAEGFIRDKLAELSRLEAERCDSFDRAAEPFGELMAYVCAYGFETDSPQYRIANVIGRHIGRFIYIIDAADDLEADIKTGAYNPFRMMYKEPEAEFEQHIPNIKTALTMELMGVERAVELIDFSAVPEYGELIRNIIYLGLPELCERILNKNSAEKAEDGE